MSPEQELITAKDSNRKINFVSFIRYILISAFPRFNDIKDKYNNPLYENLSTNYFFNLTSQYII
ncbi:MAG: hypothetical protein A2X04_17910 [Bacteroidetes bacterium GWF2_41_9]|nr:MAG: hypothetical protein A2X04_17910 [Bacteroidetes bacterium GWF2_41_9]HAM10503.1 hypothetical protein [Bacteroidales bacterium]